MRSVDHAEFPENKVGKVMIQAAAGLKALVANPPDVIVIGGGPSGATTATLVAQKGHRVVLLERERFPRYHIGESLIPETFWVLERLGMLPNFAAAASLKSTACSSSPNRANSRPRSILWNTSRTSRRRRGK